MRPCNLIKTLYQLLYNFVLFWRENDRVDRETRWTGPGGEQDEDKASYITQQQQQ